MDNKKLTDSEIVKALECCAKDEKDEIVSCKERGCPFHKKCKNDINVLEKAALDLINRQKAEIEELRKGFTADMDYFASEYDTKIKSEAIKELREKCLEQQEFLIGEDGKFKGYVSFEDMDNIISDMEVVAENAITAE